MALTPQETAFVTQLKKEWKSKEEAGQALQKMREWGNPFTQFLQWVGKETYNIGSQLSRLAPWNQSADPTSFYSRAQRDMQGADIERAREWYNPEAFSSKFGEFVWATAPTIPLSMWVWAVAKWLLGLGLKVAPKVASKALPFVTAPTKATSFADFLKFASTEGAKDVATYDLLTKWETSLKSVATGAIAWPIIGTALRWASKFGGYLSKLPETPVINKSKAGAYTEWAVETGKKILSGLSDVAENIKAGASRIPSNIKTNVAAQKTTNEAIKKLPSIKAQNAVRDGVELPDVQILPKVVKPIKEQAKQLVKAVRDFEANPRATNPIEIVGKPIVQKLQTLQKQAQWIGAKLWTVAKTGLGKVTPQETLSPVFNSLKRVSWLNGLKINKGKLDFSNTTLSSSMTKWERVEIQKAFNKAVRSETGEQKHLFRQELFEILWGRKKSLTNITDTQEKALDAIRKGLSDVLEGKNPQYKTLSNEYRKLIQPLTEMRRFMKTLPDATEDIMDMKAGLLARRLTSNAVSNPQVRQLLRNLDKATGWKTTESVEAMQDLYNILDKYYSIAGKTGFQSQVQSGVQWSIKWTIIEWVKQFAWKSEAVTKKAMDDLLEELLR